MKDLDGNAGFGTLDEARLAKSFVKGVGARGDKLPGPSNNTGVPDYLKAAMLYCGVVEKPD